MKLCPHSKFCPLETKVDGVKCCRARQINLSKVNGHFELDLLAQLPILKDHPIDKRYNMGGESEVVCLQSQSPFGVKPN